MICRVYVAKGRMQEAEELFYDMLKDGHTVDATIYNCLVKGYCDNRCYVTATRVFKEMIDRRYVINLTRFSTLVSELCGKEKLFEAKELFKEMSKSCLIIDVDTYEGLWMNV